MTIHLHQLLGLFLKIVLFIVLVGLLSQCYEKETFPNTPVIKLESLAFSEQKEDRISDSLILAFSFTDGNGDLGLPTDDFYFPINDFFVVVNSVDKMPIGPTTQPFPTTQLLSVPRIHIDNRAGKFPNIYSYSLQNNVFIPRASLPPYNCHDYEIVYINDSKTDYFAPGKVTNYNPNLYQLDTVLIERNPFRFNFHLEFYKKMDNGEFQLFNDIYRPNDVGCFISLNGRFPILKQKSENSPLAGTIRYAIPHLSYRLILRNNTYKLKFYIYDWQFNKSNVVETPPFTLDEILQK